MPRSKSFDPSHALDSAIVVFRRHGYEGASMQALLRGMGISRQSLYDTFGGKPELYRAALRRYLEGLDRHLERLRAQDAGLDAVRAFFDALPGQLTARDSAACLLSSAALERAQHDPEIEALARQHRLAVRRALRAALRRAQKGGELSPGADVDVLSLMLTNAQLGLTLLARTGASRAELRKVAQATLQLL